MAASIAARDWAGYAGGRPGTNVPPQGPCGDARGRGVDRVGVPRRRGIVQRGSPRVRTNERIIPAIQDHLEDGQVRRTILDEQYGGLVMQ